ncbi:unnamed protein product [Bemisia tabaci]|uniref:Metalloendopeptidase n=1 Tax=Bemisia tabaci TaxID=7038 RepID=A0A9P0A8E9_BEMTA|nr:unnamed protein product [Bemisia tabaci]
MFLGLFHELARPDRDLYVDVFPENIRPEHMEDLKKLSPDEINLLGKPFDTKSIMMYASDVGAKGNPIQRLLNPAYKTKCGRVLIWPKYHLSAGDVQMINDLYRCPGSTQKPSFPVDVLCDFTTRGACGFKWQPLGTWQWQRNPGDKQGFLVSKLSQSLHEAQKLELWTVNFHGLSPLDTERGPNGCVHFKYLRRTMIEPGLASLKLFQVDLITPLDQKYEEAQSSEIWSDGSEINQASELETWNHVSVGINVSEPFMLKFVSKFADHSPNDEIKIGGFELRYSPCEDPGVVSERTRIGNAKSGKNYSNEPTVGITKTRSCWWRSFSGLFLLRSSSKVSSLLRSSSIASSMRSSSNASPVKSPSSGSSIRSSKSFSGNKRRPKLYN